MRRLRRTSLSISLAIILVGCGWRYWSVRQHRGAMVRIEEAMQSGRYAAAARDLSALLASRPGSDDVAFRLGLCEKARGRLKEADAAWARVLPDSPTNGRAIMARMDLLLEQGKLADAEELIDKAAKARGPDGWALRMLLIPTLVQEGRTNEALRTIESRWHNLNDRGEGDTEQAINLARLAIEIRSNPPPADAVRTYLEQLAKLAPDDDRIWLARANLALRTGALDEANHWIFECLNRRAEDPAVWRAQLAWAIATNRIADVQTALKHIPADHATPAEIARLSAWLAAARGDGESERQHLTTLVAQAPEDFAARERLEKLHQTGSSPEITSLSKQRIEIEHAQTRYRELYTRNQPARDAPEMSRLAEQLGHPFEAIAFLTAALGEEPDRADFKNHLKQLEEQNAIPVSAAATLHDLADHRCTPVQRESTATLQPAS